MPQPQNSENLIFALFLRLFYDFSESAARILLSTGHPIIFLKKYGKYGNFFRKNMGGIWAILEFSWQNLAKIWEIWRFFSEKYGRNMGDFGIFMAKFGKNMGNM